MELVFHKENGLYITEFEVTSDFNVHLERSKGGKVSFYQKTTDGNYDHIEKLSKNIDKVFDYDFQALVYPKIIKITSECEFDVASLTTDGEVTEIKSQSKEVEITANGVTEIAPDAGFGYLSGVKVNVNVPQSGGDGGDAPSGGSNYIYMDWEPMKQSAPSSKDLIGAFMMVGVYAVSAKTKVLDSVGIAPTSLLGTLAAYEGEPIETVVRSVVALAFDLNLRIFENGSMITVGEKIGNLLMSGMPLITEEQFYNLEA